MNEFVSPGTFTELHKTTIGLDFLAKELTREGRVLKLQVCF